MIGGGSGRGSELGRGLGSGSAGRRNSTRSRKASNSTMPSVGEGAAEDCDEETTVVDCMDAEEIVIESESDSDSGPEDETIIEEQNGSDKIYEVITVDPLPVRA